jgi:hypothetical protein
MALEDDGDGGGAAADEAAAGGASPAPQHGTMPAWAVSLKRAAAQLDDTPLGRKWDAAMRSACRKCGRNPCACEPEYETDDEDGADAVRAKLSAWAENPEMLAEMKAFLEAPQTTDNVEMQ